MNIEDIIYDIETHPIVVALGVFALIFIVVLFRRKNATPTSVANDLANPPPTSLETYNQTFTSYPVVEPPPQPTPVVQPPPAIIPPPVHEIVPPPVIVHTPPPVVHTTPPPSTIVGVYIHPGVWPSQTSTLSGIASKYGLTLSKLESMNQWIYNQRHTWNLIYPSDSIKVS